MAASSVEVVVQRQVEAYNAGDLDAFCASYSDDVVVLDADGTEVVRGMPALRDMYQRVFLEGHSGEVVSRLVVGPWVVDHEIVHSGGRRLEGLVAYRVGDDGIERVQMLAG